MKGFVKAVSVPVLVIAETVQGGEDSTRTRAAEWLSIFGMMRAYRNAGKNKGPEA